jgi:cysteate synthase
MNGSHYRLVCPLCGRVFADSEEGFRLSCDGEHPAALLRAEYEEKRFAVDAEAAGLFRYRRWLPIRRCLSQGELPAVFRSSVLADRLGLEELWFAFSGYWPERGAFLQTCSFKELEAVPVCARVPEGEDRSLVVASAGNTGRAFLQIASMHGTPTIVVVPEAALPEMWITVEKHPLVSLAVLGGRGDYADAIDLAGRIAATEGCYAEGGARNVARRDGMGTLMLAAAERIGALPDHYVQAVGSGTGGIGAWEMNQRLAGDGRFGTGKTRLHLVQNEPFAIMTDAWTAGRRELTLPIETEAKRQIAGLHSPVLSNRKPPYGLVGGVYDALADSEGCMYAVGNREATVAGRMFEELEGCDLDPAAEVALAGLVQALRSGRIDPRERVLVNLTGGGRRRLAGEGRMRQVEADLVFGPEEVDLLTIERKLSRETERITV